MRDDLLLTREPGESDRNENVLEVVFVIYAACHWALPQ